MVLRFRTHARRRTVRPPRLVGALAIMVTILFTGVVVPERAAADVVASAELAGSGTAAERLWLLAGLALSLAAAGVVAIAAARGRRNQ